MVKKSDPYLKMIDKYWNEIISMYLAFKKRNPIIEFDPNRIRIILRDTNVIAGIKEMGGKGVAQGMTRGMFAPRQ